jgi:hypothetical protein
MSMSGSLVRELLESDKRRDIIIGSIPPIAPPWPIIIISIRGSEVRELLSSPNRRDIINGFIAGIAGIPNSGFSIAEAVAKSPKSFMFVIYVL